MTRIKIILASAILSLSTVHPSVALQPDMLPQILQEKFSQCGTAFNEFKSSAPDTCARNQSVGKLKQIIFEDHKEYKSLWDQHLDAARGGLPQVKQLVNQYPQKTQAAQWIVPLLAQPIYDLLSGVNQLSPEHRDCVPYFFCEGLKTVNLEGNAPNRLGQLGGGLGNLGTGLMGLIGTFAGNNKDVKIANNLLDVFHTATHKARTQIPAPQSGGIAIGEEPVNPSQATPFYQNPARLEAERKAPASLATPSQGSELDLEVINTVMASEDIPSYLEDSVREYLQSRDADYLRTLQDAYANGQLTELQASALKVLGIQLTK